MNDVIFLNCNSIGEGGGGKIHHATQNLMKKCPCSHNNNNSVIEYIFMLKTASHDKNLKFQFKI